jgi:hypothetical protein
LRHDVQIILQNRKESHLITQKTDRWHFTLDTNYSFYLLPFFAMIPSFTPPLRSLSKTQLSTIARLASSKITSLSPSPAAAAQTTPLKRHHPNHSTNITPHITASIVVSQLWNMKPKMISNHIRKSIHSYLPILKKTQRTHKNAKKNLVLNKVKKES